MHMAKTETIVIDTDIAERLRRKVTSGQFATADDALRAALDSLDGAGLVGWSTAEIREMVEASDSEGGELPIDEARVVVQERLRARFADKV